MKDKIIYVAILVGIVTYSFWEHFPKGSFYIGNALFIFALCLHIFISDKKSFIKFILFSLSINNLLDEIMFDNSILNTSELITCIVIVIIGIIRFRNNDRRRTDSTGRII